MGAPAIHSGSRVSLHPLTIRQEDGEFFLGRVQAGTFAFLPEIDPPSSTMASADDLSRNTRSSQSLWF